MTISLDWHKEKSNAMNKTSIPSLIHKNSVMAKILYLYIWSVYYSSALLLFTITSLTDVYKKTSMCFTLSLHRKTKRCITTSQSITNLTHMHLSFPIYSCNWLVKLSLPLGQVSTIYFTQQWRFGFGCNPLWFSHVIMINH